MRIFPRLSVSTLAVATVWVAAACLGHEELSDTSAELDARRLVAKAYYENDQFAESIEAYRRCVALVPESAIDHFNLALALMRAKRYEDSHQSLDRAQELNTDLLGTRYIRGTVFKRQRKYEEALRSLQEVTDRDGDCFGAWYNAGVCLKNLDKHNEALSCFQRAAELQPNHPSAHYQLITLYRRLGDVESAMRHKEIFTRVKEMIDESEKTVEALERSRYTYIIQAPRLTKDLEPRPDSGRRFVDATKKSGLAARALPKSGWQVGGAIALDDYDGDGDIDVYVVDFGGGDDDDAKNRLFNNRGDGTYADVTDTAGVGDAHHGLDAVFGDFDNDGHTDLYVANAGPNALYRNKGDGTFEDVSRKARVDEPQYGRRVLFVDYDHDNDLDILIGNALEVPRLPKIGSSTPDFPLSGAFNALLRNNGNGTFSDQTDEAGLLVDPAHTRDVLVADFEGDHDTDILVVNADGPAHLFLNDRRGTMRSAGSFSPPLTGRVWAAAEGDFNRDGMSDLLIAVLDQLVLYTNLGAARFEGRPVAIPEAMSSVGIGRMGILDFNNDGWPDVWLVDNLGKSLCLLAGDGPCRFVNATRQAGLGGPFGHIADLGVADVNGDGDEDIVLHTRDRGLVLLDNSSQPSNWLNVKLIGKKVNKRGCGATVELASGGHYQRQVMRGGSVHFGLGRLVDVDVVRVVWPNGVAQNVIKPSVNTTLTIQERVRVSASCGFLWAYNGSKFELVNEILGIGPLGVPMAPGVYHQPDCTELTKIEAEQLVATDGAFELRLTEDLRELMYADQISLRVVDHPASLEVIPNEMFTAPPFPEDKLFAVSEHIPPRSALNDRGDDVLDLVRRRDGRFPTFALTHYDGLAETHTLTLDFGQVRHDADLMLFLDGWIYWSDSSTVMAIAQDPGFRFEPLSLEVKDAAEIWRTVIPSVGLPTSKGLVVPVNMTGRFLSEHREIRLSTNMCIYFDRIFASTRDEAVQCQVTELPADRAWLRHRGFSQIERDAHGFERFVYANPSSTGPWGPPAGHLTRYGDVTLLLTAADDMYVIFGPGDELRLRFDAVDLPEAPVGWTRGFVFYADGWVKDGDLNTTYSDTVTPLPFHGMSGYPYPDSEHYPDTPAHEEYRRTYNTRTGARRAELP